MFEALALSGLLAQNVYQGTGGNCKTSYDQNHKVVSEVCDHQNVSHGHNYKHYNYRRVTNYKYFEHYRQQKPVYQHPVYHPQSRPSYPVNPAYPSYPTHPNHQYPSHYPHPSRY